MRTVQTDMTDARGVALAVSLELTTTTRMLRCTMGRRCSPDTVAQLQAAARMQAILSTIEQHLSEVGAARHKLRRSTMVTSNRVVQDWGAYLGDNTMGSTILDRLMHHCHSLEFDGRSYRLKEAAETLARKSKAS